MKLSIVSVTCGPGKLAYQYLKVPGDNSDYELHVWTGEHVTEAPPDATVIEFVPGCTSWFIQETVDQPG